MSHPDWVPSQWHWDQHLNDLERAVAGAEGRLAELRAMKTHPEEIESAERTVEFAKAEFAKWGAWGQNAAEKRA